MIIESMLRSFPQRSIKVWISLVFVSCIVFVFYHFSLKYAEPNFSYYIEADNFLYDGLSIFSGISLPLFGPNAGLPVLINFCLGPLLAYQIAIAMKLVGLTPINIWYVLITFNLIGIISLFFVLNKLIGIKRSILCTMLLISAPALYQVQAAYFHHVQYALPYIIGLTCALCWFNMIGGKATWYLAVLFFSLAVHFHVTAYVLVVPLLMVALVNRHSFSFQSILFSLFIFFVCNYYIATFHKQMHH